MVNLRKEAPMAMLHCSHPHAKPCRLHVVWSPVSTALWAVLPTNSNVHGDFGGSLHLVSWRSMVRIGCLTAISLSPSLENTWGQECVLVLGNPMKGSQLPPLQPRALYFLSFYSQCLSLRISVQRVPVYLMFYSLWSSSWLWLVSHLVSSTVCVCVLMCNLQEGKNAILFTTVS